MTKKELKKLKDNLPMGWAKIIATRTGHAKITIYRVLSGDYENLEISEAAIALAEETQLQRQAAREKISLLENGCNDNA